MVDGRTSGNQSHNRLVTTIKPMPFNGNLSSKWKKFKDSATGYFRISLSLATGVLFGLSRSTLMLDII